MAYGTYDTGGILKIDSLGNVILGYESTKDVTMQDMIRHTGAVRRGAVSSFIVSDMPYKSYSDASMAVLMLVLAAIGIGFGYLGLHVL